MGVASAFMALSWLVGGALSGVIYNMAPNAPFYAATLSYGMGVVLLIKPLKKLTTR